MSLPLIPTLALAILIITLIYRFLFHPLFLHPLRHIPSAHWSAPFSSLWILSHRLAQTDTPVIHSLHQEHGSILRLAPNELSLNSYIGGLRTIYSGGFEKGSWYKNVFGNYGVEPMFAMSGHGEHSRRKRMVSGVYAKSLLLASEALEGQTRVTVEELRGRLRDEMAERQQEGIEFYDIFCAATMDFVSSYIFGLKNGTKFTRKEKEEGIALFHDFKARQKYTFWPQECAGVTKFLKMLGLKWVVVPAWVDQANRDLEAWLMGLCEKAKATTREMDGDEDGERDVKDFPTVYAHLEKALVKERINETEGTGEKPTKCEDAGDDLIRLEIASELLDHTLAGFDTSSITLTWLAWELSKPSNAKWQVLLRAEITSLNGSLDAKAIDSLPVLHAILVESLRLHAAIPGQQPRLTPQGTLTSLGDPETGSVYTKIPPGTRVQCHAYSLHRIPSVFPEPDSWLPDRWLSSPSPSSSPSDPSCYKPLNPSSPALRDMTRHFWAFGSGGRMCVGSNLAILDMKAIIVGVWAKHETWIVDDKGMVMNGGYMAEPLGVAGVGGKGGLKGIGGKYAADGGRRRFLRLGVREVGSAA